MNTPELRHNISVCFDTAAVPREPLTAPALPAGITMRPLRKLEDGTLRSAILNIPAGWHSDALRVAGGPQQYFVLSGQISLGHQHLGTNAFFSGFVGDVIPALTSQNGAEVIAIYDAGPSYAAAEGSDASKSVHIIPDAFQIPFISPEIAGVKLVGFERRVLWENPANGADTRLLRVPAGFQGRGPNWHPVHEEIYHIAGDGGPDDSRRLSTGWFLWNPAYTVHGYHEHSAEGMTLLEWHDGKWAFIPYKPEAA